MMEFEKDRHPEEPAQRASRRAHEAGAAGVPLAVAELAAALDALGGFEARPRIAVAVSGGPDSMALILLAQGWARTPGGEAAARGAGAARRGAPLGAAARRGGPGADRRSWIAAGKRRGGPHRRRLARRPRHPT